MFERFHFRLLAFVALLPHPFEQLGAQGGLLLGVSRVIGQIAGLERVFHDVVKLLGRTFLITLDLPACEFVRGGFLLPRIPPLFFGIRGHALERRFGRQVHDIGEPFVAHRADGVIFRTGVDAAAGLYAVYLFLELVRLSLDDGQETASVEFSGYLSARDVHQRRSHVHVFAHGVGRRSGLHDSGPADQESRLQAFVIAGPLGERERIALFAGEDEDRVFVESVFVQQRVHRSDLIVQYVDLRQIVAELFARFGRIDQIVRQREILRVPQALVAEVPRVVRLGRTDVEEERFARFGHICKERLYLFRAHAAFALLVFREVLEREGFERGDMTLALQRDAVTRIFEVFGQRFDAVVYPRMVGISARPHGIESRQQTVARGRTHGRRLKEAFEPHALGRNAVDVGRNGVGTSVASEVVMAAVVGDYQHDIGAFGGLLSGRFCRACGLRALADSARGESQRDSQSYFREGIHRFSDYFSL